MNTWSINLLKELLNIKDIINVSEDIFDYMRIVDLNNVKYEQKALNTLFFMSYSTDDDIKNGFIIKSFDLRSKANEVIKNNINYTFVIDEETYQNLDYESKKAKLIIVDNILDSIDKLYKYILMKKKAQVVAVTGSVGKTTTVGLIEKVLKTKYKVLRIYSKRITPIILKANLINFLNDSYDYIVLEMSIYHKDHVEILSDLLNPDIAAIININSSHLEYFSSIEDICKYKASIFRYAKYGFYNNLDKLINNLRLDNHKLYYKDDFIYDTKMISFDKLFLEDIKMNEDYLEYDNAKIKLFFASTLSAVQAIVSYKIGLLCKIAKKDIIKAIQEYVPVENRIQKKKAFGKEIIFDGDITTNERIKELADNNYKECYLVIRKFGSMENNKRFEKVLPLLDLFTKVFVFSDIEYLDMFKNHKKVVIVNNHDFMKELNGKIIYHYSGYYRSFKEYKEENLNILENEIYKIMKPEV